jgi:Phospholipase_D-nuclease N-terminal
VVRLLIIAAVVLFLALWVRALFDLFRRPDLSGSARGAWAIIMLILPFIGLLVYTMMRPSEAEIARNARS